MFEYAKIKAELERVKCPVHTQSATIVIADGNVVFENVCCEEHRKKLKENLWDLEQENLADILQEIY